MGATGGVELRANSIRIHFKYRGKARKETLYMGADPMSPTPANGKYAARVAADVKRRIADGSFKYVEYFPHSPHKDEQEAGVSMLHAIMDKWLRTADLKGSTKTTYRRRIDNFWKKALKDQPIAEVRYSDILEALKTGTWKSGKSRNNELSMIKQAFEMARRDRLVKENPCEEVERAESQKAKPDPFDLAEVRQILSHLQAHRPEQILNFVQLMFFTGLRTSEGIALRWGHIDFQKREMLVEGANVYDAESETTKTYESRIVKLTSSAMEALERQKAHTFLAGKHVFHDPKTGEPWAYAKITDVRSFWESTLKKLGIRYRRPYNMRHTYATMGLMSGAKPGFMASQLGHGLRMFFTTYAKWLNGTDDDREMAKLEEAIAKNSPGIPQPSGPHQKSNAR
jgi:integrase